MDTHTLHYHDISALRQLRADAVNNKTGTLRAAAQQLESVFLGMILKNMRATVTPFQSTLYSRDKEDFYQGMLNDQWAVSLSKSGGIGLADVIVKQMERYKGKVTEPEKKVIRRQIFDDKKSIKNTPHATPEKVDNNKGFRELFVDNLLPLAKKAAEMIGIDPKLLLAQSALETGWGKHVISNNLFGMKAHSSWKGGAASAKTVEYTDGKPEKNIADFRSYDSYAQSFLDYVNLLKTPRYQEAIKQAKEPLGFLTQLHQAGYATDPDYVEKVFSIYREMR